MNDKVTEDKDNQEYQMGIAVWFDRAYEIQQRKILQLQSQLTTVTKQLDEAVELLETTYDECHEGIVKEFLAKLGRKK